MKVLFCFWGCCQPFQLMVLGYSTMSVQDMLLELSYVTGNMDFTLVTLYYHATKGHFVA